MIRSLEKLTAGGMTFLDTDVVRVLEEVLPARFGGGPTDHQLVEQETRTGDRSSACWCIRPSERWIPPRFLAAISRSPGAEAVMGLAWRDAELLRVERSAPVATAAGKILHLHVARGGGARA